MLDLKNPTKYNSQMNGNQLCLSNVYIIFEVSRDSIFLMSIRHLIDILNSMEFIINFE